eukprot:CAMPEP_0168533794 /NCGR_PEP_ID=MMETSP0405-20121227/17372_1 /TAXON_ID=498012 /ORGANISM="Trichosphaerium sp, Strain Am-I-7 wt" /LENGTH=249 /DNA_ID=CAMNT_0008560089 /DNA_START=578 /DNA_END=1327 /DNA_ORIENTATION=+
MVLTSQHEGARFRVRIRLLNPSTLALVHPCLEVFSAPIRVVSKRDQLRNRGQAKTSTKRGIKRGSTSKNAQTERIEKLLAKQFQMYNDLLQEKHAAHQHTINLLTQRIALVEKKHTNALELPGDGWGKDDEHSTTSLPSSPAEAHTPDSPYLNPCAPKQEAPTKLNLSGAVNSALQAFYDTNIDDRPTKLRKVISQADGETILKLSEFARVLYSACDTGARFSTQQTTTPQSTDYTKAGVRCIYFVKRN